MGGPKEFPAIIREIHIVDSAGISKKTGKAKDDVVYTLRSGLEAARAAILLTLCNHAATCACSHCAALAGTLTARWSTTHVASG